MRGTSVWNLNHDIKQRGRASTLSLFTATCDTTAKKEPRGVNAGLLRNGKRPEGLQAKDRKALTLIRREGLA
jgi:hypothetical protein